MPNAEQHFNWRMEDSVFLSNYFILNQINLCSYSFS